MRFAIHSEFPDIPLVVGVASSDSYRSNVTVPGKRAPVAHFFKIELLLP